MPSESTGPKHELKRRLREAGLRATNARTLVLECLTEAGRALTHAEVCEAVSDHGYVLETGAIALEGPAQQLAADTRVIDTYLGSQKS